MAKGQSALAQEAQAARASEGRWPRICELCCAREVRCGDVF